MFGISPFMFMNQPQGHSLANYMPFIGGATGFLSEFLGGKSGMEKLQESNLADQISGRKRARSTAYDLYHNPGQNMTYNKGLINSMMSNKANQLAGAGGSVDDGQFKGELSRMMAPFWIEMLNRNRQMGFQGLMRG